MTDNDPWGATMARNDTTYATADTAVAGQTTVVDDLTGNNEGYDPLFGGERLISLFDKTIGVGVERSGIITKAPEDRQSRFYKAGGAGALKFWVPKGATWADGKPVTDKSVDPVTGEKLRPCMDTVFVLQTDERLSDADLAAREMDEDNGLRGVFASGAQLKAIRDAIRAAGVSSRTALVGMRLTLVRTGTTVKGDFEAWNWLAKLDRV